MASSADFGRPNTSIAASNANGAGTEFAITGKGRVDIGWNVVIDAGGTYSALQVDLEGSIDGTNWSQLDSITQTTTTGMRSLVAECPQFVRANKISSTTSGGTPLVTVQILIRRS